MHVVFTVRTDRGKIRTANEDAYGFASTEQRNTLIKLQRELDIIREITELMGEWISENKGKITFTNDQ